MDYASAKIILKKLSTLIDSFESLDEPISEIESEMLLKYIDKLRSTIPGNLSNPADAKVVEKIITKSVTPTAQIEEVQIPQSAKGETKPKAIVTKTIEPPILAEQFDVPPVPEVAMKVVKEAEPEAVKIKENLNTGSIKILDNNKKSKKALVGVDDGEDEGGNSDLWSKIEIADISDKLSNSPIKDIIKAISINERIFTQNELFGGDNLVFRSTVEQIEKCNSIEEAFFLLQNGVAKKYEWDSATKVKKANNFVRLVQRRFL